MILRDLRDLIGKDRREQERAEAIRMCAIGMSIAAVLGVATGILIAPQSGRETRQDIKEKAANTADLIKSTVQDQIYIMKDSLADACEETSEAIKESQAKAEKVKKDVTDTTKKD